MTCKACLDCIFIHKRTADCNWQMSGNDRNFLTTNPTALTGATNIAKTIVNTINRIFEKTTGRNFTSVISRRLNLTPKLSYEEKRKQNKENLQNSNEKCYFAR